MNWIERAEWMRQKGGGLKYTYMLKNLLRFFKLPPSKNNNQKL